METEADTPWLSPTEQFAWHTHLAVTRMLAHQLERDLQPFGLSLGDYEVLVTLSESAAQRMRMNVLATAIFESRSRLSHHIARMENAGLVRRERCTSDLRGFYAILTDHGARMMRTVAPHHARAIRRHFTDLLSHEALAGLHTSLEIIEQHLHSLRDGR
ncbi:MarR family transcriptional regulator [Streptomyces sp. NPDC005728]|uniref:MarR family winged helix-turn-helix transcriptional regulator n=1 Tax=Streptomyces sp. NPDC005728 TaxID=3157054 RepID=UPI0033F5F2FD